MTKPEIPRMNIGFAERSEVLEESSVASGFQENLEDVGASAFESPDDTKGFTPRRSLETIGADTRHAREQSDCSANVCPYADGENIRE